MLKLLLHVLKLPSPFEVNSHARDDRQVMCTTKLKNLTSSVKVPDLHNLKSITF